MYWRPSMLFAANITKKKKKKRERERVKLRYYCGS